MCMLPVLQWFIFLFNFLFFYLLDLSLSDIPFGLVLLICKSFAAHLTLLIYIAGKLLIFWSWREQTSPCEVGSLWEVGSSLLMYHVTPSAFLLYDGIHCESICHYIIMFDEGWTHWHLNSFFLFFLIGSLGYNSQDRCAEKLNYKKRKEKEQLEKREKEELRRKRFQLNSRNLIHGRSLSNLNSGFWPCRSWLFSISRTRSRSDDDTDDEGSKGRRRKGLELLIITHEFHLYFISIRPLFDCYVLA